MLLLHVSIRMVINSTFFPRKDDKEGRDLNADYRWIYKNQCDYAFFSGLCFLSSYSLTGPLFLKIAKDKRVKKWQTKQKQKSKKFPNKRLV